MTRRFLPVRVHIKEQEEDFKRLAFRYGAHWTPAILMLDPEGKEQYRIEGFLGADEFLVQLELGLAHVKFEARDYPDAERRFRHIVERHGATEGAAEAQYWAGVARYKASGDAAALKETARAFHRRYRESSWAVKASVWE